MTDLTKAAQQALEALEEIALAGMSGTGQESEEGMRDWHARQAWKFISIAARALDPLRTAMAQHPAAQAVQMTWPKARDVGRFGDMDPMDHIRVGLDSDNDVYVSVWGKDGGASVEFCNPGGGGGGSSRRTREALIALMVAMEADNAERPDKDWWARRTAQAEGGA